MKTKDLGVASSKILQFFPYAIASLPYDFALQVVRAGFTDMEVSIWSRNGHALGTLTPGASDLDITVWSGGIPKEKRDDFFPRYEKLKYLLPFLGEVNWIESECVEDFVSYLNPMEADRDPELKSKIAFSKSKSLSHKICFFIRCLASDTYGIRTDFSSRKRKWNRHLIDLELGEYCDKLNSPSEIFNLCEEELLIANLQGYQKGYLGKLVQSHHQDINAWNRFYSMSNTRDFLLLSPNRWLGASLHHDKLESDLTLLSSFSELETELFINQLEWEIWGLFTQYHQISDREGLIRHLENFKKVALALPDYPHLYQGFDNLIKLQRLERLDILR